MSQVAAAKAQVLAQLARSSGSPEESAAFQAFATEAVERLRGPFLISHPPRRALSFLEEAWRFSKDRADAVKVSIRPRPGGFTLLTNLPDQPFIVDTIRLFLRAAGATWDGGFNLVLPFRRDSAGQLVGVGGDAPLESLVSAQGHGGDLLSDPDVQAASLTTALTLARAVVSDFAAMTDVVRRTADRADGLAQERPADAQGLRETAELLRWLDRENFVYMGACADRPLGLLRLAEAPSDGSWPAAHSGTFVRVRKSWEESRVHRAGRLDELLVELPDGHQLFLRGMFTHRAITATSRNVPVLRRVLVDMLSEVESLPGSHRHKGLSNVFDALPTEILFATSRDSVLQLVERVFEAEQAGDVGASFHELGRGEAFAVVAMPKASWSDDVRAELQDLLQAAFSARFVDHAVHVGRFETLLLRFHVSGGTWPGDAARAALGTRIRDLAAPWQSRLWTALAAASSDDAADRLIEGWTRAFPAAWTRAVTIEQTACDVLELDKMATANETIRAKLQTVESALQITLYEARDVTLTRVLPVLGHLGFEAKDAVAFTVSTPTGPVHIDRFRIATTHGADVATVLKRATAIEDAIVATLLGRTEDDTLNALVVRADLGWRDVDVLRAYSRYCRQHQIKVLVARVREILITHPICCTALVAWFRASFDPDLTGDRAKAMVDAEARARDELRLVTGYDENLILNAIAELIGATLRTNRWRTDRNGDYLSFKFDCSRAARLMGERRPMYEIYVHGVEVEGVHLRFGRVARGGLRWSDRDDYRTEVLSLVTTQLVKNVVIVPTGSKGGFLLKNPSQDPKVRRAQADRHYETFIRGLLDLTDNAVEGRPVPPRGVVCHDAPDPYLVVAADKGTAHLSDTANRISREYGFWLDDAFASGGSNGYDHKKVGITARGGWVLVRRHFAELGLDPYTQPFTCFGIGDMGGDVFGNGLIETPHARLLAAFNHLHIFLDPNPPTAAAAERKRLFDTMGGWDQYDTKLISEGGGVFARSARLIPLSPRAAKMLGLDGETEAEPERVMHQILQMEVDLFWNGGIGTYVKAADETHAQADDRSNDGNRVDGTQLRSRVVGDGGNLGFTQKGRIEAARRGIRLNSDAIDNSGGVDLSDHEVNLKILLGPIVARGALTTDQRNTLLSELTAEVADLVLENNDTHGVQLSRDEIRSRRDLSPFASSIRFVETHMGQTRASLRLPTDEELARRAATGDGLSRPELAVLSAWVKMFVFARLIEQGPSGLPGYDAMLRTYFPASIQERYPDDLQRHMLANEIVATVATTRIVGMAGVTLFPSLLEASGRSVLDVATFWIHATDLAGLKALRGDLEAKVLGPALHARYEAFVAATDGIAEVVRTWLGRGPAPTETTAMAAAVAALPARKRDPADVETWIAAGLPAAVARRCAQLRNLDRALGVWEEAQRIRVPFAALLAHTEAVSAASGLGRVLDGLASAQPAGRWEPLAVGVLRARYEAALHELVRRIPAAAPLDGPLGPVRACVDELGDDLDVSALLVAQDRIATLAARISA